MLSRLFKRNHFQLDNFAKKLADDFFSQVPPDRMTNYLAAPAQEPADAGKAVRSNPAKKGKKTGSPAESVQRHLQDMALKLAQFKVQEKLGIYGKARLHMQFMERMEELGYSKESIEHINRQLLLKTAG